MIITITLNARSVWAVYIIDRISPVTICNTNVIPSRNPMFHINEIDVGDGRSRRDVFIIFMIGLCFISCFFILLK